MGFSIFAKKNVSKGQKFNIFFRNSNDDDIPDVGDKIDIFREDGRWAGWGRVTDNFDDTPRFNAIELCGRAVRNLGEKIREIQVRG